MDSRSLSAIWVKEEVLGGSDSALEPRPALLIVMGDMVVLLLLLLSCDEGEGEGYRTSWPPVDLRGVYLRVGSWQCVIRLIDQRGGDGARSASCVVAAYSALWVAGRLYVGFL